eukprot:COSAG01_NODE_405_length_17466_cov_554.403697_18_plen_64_part_00
MSRLFLSRNFEDGNGRAGLVSLRSARRPVAYRSSAVQGVPRWRHMVQTTPLSSKLMPLHRCVC